MRISYFLELELNMPHPNRREFLESSRVAVTAGTVLGLEKFGCGRALYWLYSDERGCDSEVLNTHL